ncbi:hypothetical protein DERP_009557 [Dermatophagoides pteronyssinus]|uniref:Uncharacterized protein LOC113793440 n=2 Tax=Dermatophagoides pteronyssinus TaxID=6956 RepID=A0A6P6Y2G2_DERPT|nr:uncharacterized protein LOC113793440 [Dermatophagoides pteronyssinus]KAH9419500.1 hypothetical protein DERP_009557 [Dermatophagoides pteronyssinus]
MFSGINLAKTLAIAIWLVSFACANPVLDQTENVIQDVKPEIPSDNESGYPPFRPMFGIPFMRRMHGCCGGRRLPAVMERVLIVKPVPIPILLNLLIRKEGDSDDNEQTETKLPIAPEAQSKPDYSTSDIPLAKQGVPEPETQSKPIDESTIENNSIDQQKDQPNDTVDQTKEESKVDGQQEESKSSEVVYSDDNNNDVQNGQEAVVADDETKVDESSSIDKNDEQNENKVEENKTDDDTANYEDNGDDSDKNDDDESNFNEPTY